MNIHLIVYYLLNTILLLLHTGGHIRHLYHSDTMMGTDQITHLIGRLEDLKINFFNSNRYQRGMLVGIKCLEVVQGHQSVKPITYLISTVVLLIFKKRRIFPQYY